MATLKTNINQASADFQAIKDKIVESGVEIADGTPTREYANKIGDIYEAGQKSEYDRFWDAYQENGKKLGYTRNFSGNGWNNNTLKPKYNITAESANNMFAYCGYQGSLKTLLLERGITLTFPKNWQIGNMFEGSAFTELGIMDFSECKQSAPQHVFHSSTSLHTIEKIILSKVVSFTFKNWFSACAALKNITFEGEIANDIDFQWSTQLTRASITNIIEHLSDSTFGKTLTLSKTAVDEEFAFTTSWTDENGEEVFEVVKGTDEDNPYWWKLKATKPHWAITVI